MSAPGGPPGALALPAPADGAIEPLGGLLEQAQGFAEASHAPATRRAYTRDWDRFAVWAHDHGLSAMPASPETVALYLTHLAREGLKTSTIDRALAAIVHRHVQHDQRIDRRHPALRQVLAGIHREVGRAPEKKRPVEDEILRRLIGALGSGLRGARDRALLLTGWFGALRRSELAALRVEDLTFEDEGVRLAIRRSKTDQERTGAVVGLPYAGDPELCPVRALRAYLEALRLEDGPLFRDIRGGTVRGGLSAESVSDAVKRLCRAAGVPPEEYAAHSLRSGFATTAAKRGKSLDGIMRQGRWRSERIARGYIRHATVFVDNAAAGLL